MLMLACLKFVLAFLLSFVLLFGAGSVGLYLVFQSDPKRLEVPLEAVLSYVLKRQVEIGEVLAAHIGRYTYLAVTAVSVSNPAWAGRTPFARADRLSIRFDLGSLWNEDPIVIHRVEVDGLHLELQARDGSPPNWQFWPDTPRSKKTRGTLPFVVFSGRFDNAELSYRHGDQNVHFALERLEVATPEPGALVDVNLHGFLNGLPLTGTGQIGPDAALLSGRDLEMNLEVEWGKLQLRSRGKLEDLRTLSGADLALQLAMPEARPFLVALGVPELGEGPLDIQAELNPRKAGFAVSATGRLGHREFELMGTLDDPLHLDGLDIRLSLVAPSMTDLGVLFGVHGLPAAPYAVSGELYRQGSLVGVRQGRIRAGSGRLEFEGFLPQFPDMDGWQAQVSGQALDFELLAPLFGLKSPPNQVYELAVKLSARDDGVELIDLKLLGAKGTLTVAGSLGEAPSFRGTQLALSLAGDDLSALGGWLGLSGLPSEQFQISGELARKRRGWQLNQGRLASEMLDLHLQGWADSLRKPEQVEGELTLAVPDLSRALSVYGLETAIRPGLSLRVRGAVHGAPDNLLLENGDAVIGRARARFSGTLGDPMNLQGLALDLNLAGQDLLEFFPGAALANLPPAPLNVAGHLTSVPQGLRLERAEGKLAGATIGLNMLVSNNPGFQGSALTMAIRGDDLGATLSPWASVELPHKPFETNVDLQYDPGHVRVRQLDVRVGSLQLSAQLDAMVTRDEVELNPIHVQAGKTDFSGSVRGRLNEPRDFSVDFRSETLDLSFLMPDAAPQFRNQPAVVGEPGFSPNELTRPFTEQERSDRVIPDFPLDLDWMDEINGSIRYVADKIYLRPSGPSKGLLDIRIQDGALATRQFAWDGPFGSGNLQLSISKADRGRKFDLYLDTRRIPLLWLVVGEPDSDTGRRYRLHLMGTGNSLRDIAASLNGALLYKGSGGRFNNQALDLMLGDVFDTVIQRLNPFATVEPYTEVICSAGAVVVKNGLIQVAPGMVMRTAQVDIAAGGTIDLNDESLSVVFDTRARRGIGINPSEIITPYVKLGGNLANPRLVLDRNRSLTSGGAAVATVGLSIFVTGLWDRWVTAAREPCALIFLKAEEGREAELKALLAEPPLWYSAD